MKHNAKRTDDVDTLTFARPTKDARGNQITELHAVEGVQWKLTTIPLMVPTGRARKTASPILIGGQAATEPEVAPIFVPVWEIVQVLGDRAAVWHVPVELAFVRMARVPVEMTDADGKVVGHELLRAEDAARVKADREKRAAVERGDAEVH